MNETIRTIMMVALLLVMAFTGYMIRDVEGQYTADQYLVGKIQDAQADRNGFEQLYNTCTWELDNERTVDLKIVRDD